MACGLAENHMRHAMLAGSDSGVEYGHHNQRWLSTVLHWLSSPSIYTAKKYRHFTAIVIAVYTLQVRYQDISSPLQSPCTKVKLY